MVEMADPKFGDIVCDPASGSGGFLIRFFAKVRERLTAEADAEYEATRAVVQKRKLPAKKKAELLRKADEHRRRLLDVKNDKAPLWQLSNRCIYGTDANGRMARTSKMNMIMHGDGHGGLHEWNGFLNVNGIFDGRFDVILTNPPFGAHVEASAVVEIPAGKEWEESKRRYNREYGQFYKDAVARVEAAKGKPIASLFDLPKRDGDGSGKVGKIKTELLFIERCLDLLTDGGGKKPGGRLGIVLPEGVFNNPSLQWVRDFVEDRAWLRAVVSLPQDTFVSSGVSVKCSILFLQKFSSDEKQSYDATRATARAEIEAKYAPEMEKEIAQLTAEIAAVKAAARGTRAREHDEKGSARAPRAIFGAPAGNLVNAPGATAISPSGMMDAVREGEEVFGGGAKDSTRGRVRSPLATAAERLKTLQRQLAAYERAMREKIAAESRALLKQRWDYPIFLYEAEHVGITATGDAAPNELYPNDRQPPGCEKTCLELFREFERDPQGFFVEGPAV
jgi:type I restriction enzyme M protein